MLEFLFMILVFSCALCIPFCGLYPFHFTRPQRKRQIKIVMYKYLVVWAGRLHLICAVGPKILFLFQTYHIVGFRCREEDKDAYLYYILSVHGQGRTIIFCTALTALRRISSLLRVLQVDVLTVHGKMQQRARLKVLPLIPALWF